MVFSHGGILRHLTTDIYKILICITLFRMSTTDIIALIDAEIATLEQARALIAASAPTPAKKKPGRHAKATAAPSTKPKYKMSPEGRARIVAAVKARWAAKKKAAK
jgi:hypothetical protein